MLSSQPILALAAAACAIPACLGADSHAGTFEKLNRLGPLPRLCPALKAQVIASLPKEGEVRTLTAGQHRKLDSVVPVLKMYGRDMDYLFKVFDSLEARLAIHARFV